MRILLIEDDKALCQVLQPTLQAAGFASDCCHTGADGLHLLKTGYYDACILDRMLPELDGLTLLKSARADGVSIPVLMLTALGQIGDRVDGLDAGADDYLTKPFDTRELLARLRALVRRPADLNEAAHRIACGDLVLDTSQLTLTGPSSTVTLSRRENVTCWRHFVVRPACSGHGQSCWAACGDRRPRLRIAVWTVISVSSGGV